MQKIKKNILSVLLGAVIVATGYLGVIFYKSLVVLNQDHQKLIGVISWACAKDPSSCIGADGKPLQAAQTPVTPTPTPEPTSPTPENNVGGRR